jgi:photosystem II stability/assembly factor-like uncharacterized protein
MKLFAGTSKGLFVVGESQEVSAVLPERSVRDLGCAGRRMLAGAETGIFASDDDGRTWEPSGLEGRTVWKILPGPLGRDRVYAGTQPAGVFHSEDGGRSWEEMETFARAPGADRWCVPVTPRQAGRARALVADRADRKRLWVGVEVGGVVSTDDGGATWRLDLPGGNPDIHVMVAHPGRPGVLFASTGYGRLDGVAEMIEGNAGVFRSEDNGATWDYAWREVTPRYARPMCIDPRPPYALTVASAPTAFSSHRDEGGAQAMLYRTEDGGETWRSLCDREHSPSASNFHGLVSDPSEPGGVLVGTDTGEIWRVSDRGEWRCLAAGLPSVLSLLPLS